MLGVQGRKQKGRRDHETSQRAAEERKDDEGEVGEVRTKDGRENG